MKLWQLDLGNQVWLTWTSFRHKRVTIYCIKSLLWRLPNCANQLSNQQVFNWINWSELSFWFLKIIQIVPKQLKLKLCVVTFKCFLLAVTRKINCWFEPRWSSERERALEYNKKPKEREWEGGRERERKTSFYSQFSDSPDRDNRSDSQECVRKGVVCVRECSGRRALATCVYVRVYVNAIIQ